MWKWLVTVFTEDGGEYDLDEDFDSEEDAMEELDSILSNPGNIDGSPINQGCVSKK